MEELTQDGAIYQIQVFIENNNMEYTCNNPHTLFIMKINNELIKKIESNRAIASLCYDATHFIKFNEYIAKNLSVDCAILIGIFVGLETLYLRKYKRFLTKSGGYFLVKVEYIENRVGMSYHKQRKAIEMLTEYEIVSQRKWEGNVYLYRINHKSLSELLIKGAKEKLMKIEDEDNYFEGSLDKINELKEIEKEIKMM